MADCQDLYDAWQEKMKARQQAQAEEDAALTLYLVCLATKGA